MILKIILIFHGFWALIYANLNLFVKSIITLSCGAAKYSIKLKKTNNGKSIF